MTTPTPSPHISVSIINYRTFEMTRRCVRSVLAAADARDGLRVTTILVDNASGDGSADQLADWIAAEALGDRVRLVRSPTNSGFSGGHNQGITACDSDFVLVLNSDATLREDFFAPLLDAVAAHPDAGIFAARLEDPDGTPQVSCFRFQSPASELIRAAGTGPITRLLRRREVPLSVDPEAANIEWVSFACVLLRRSMIDAIGLMDEGYFLYFEDAEYALRAHRAGWRPVFVPAARAVHYRGGSGPVKALQKAKKRLPRYFYSSRSRFLTQAYGRAGLLRANLAWHLGHVVAVLRRWLSGRALPTAEGESRDIWTNYRDPLGPRHAPGE